MAFNSGRERKFLQTRAAAVSIQTQPRIVGKVSDIHALDVKLWCILTNGGFVKGIAQTTIDGIDGVPFLKSGQMKNIKGISACN